MMIPSATVSALATALMLCSCTRSVQHTIKAESQERIEASKETATASHVCDFRSFKPVRLSDWLPKGISKEVEPKYPPEAKARGIKGRVLVKILINKCGDVEQACGEGPHLLVRAAEEAALQWKFRTPTFNGAFKLSYIQEILTFEFVLRHNDLRPENGHILSTGAMAPAKR